jgi:hypothetical protein
MALLAKLAERFIESRNYVKDKNGNWVPSVKSEETVYQTMHNETFDAGDVVLFDEQGKKVIIDFMEYATNSTGVYPTLHNAGVVSSNNYTGQLFHTIKTGSRYHATPIRISEDGHPNFDVVAYDSGANDYKFNLKSPIVLADGGRLGFRHTSGTPDIADVVTVKVVYRIIEG